MNAIAASSPAPHSPTIEPPPTKGFGQWNVALQSGGEAAATPPVVAVIGAGAHGPKDVGILLTAGLLGQNPIRLAGPRNAANSEIVPYSGQIRAFTNNLNFSTVGVTDQGFTNQGVTNQGVAPTGVLNSLTLRPHQNAAIAFNTLGLGPALNQQAGSLPPKALVVNMTDSMRVTQYLDILRPDLRGHNVGVITTPIARERGVLNLFGEGSPNAQTAGAPAPSPTATAPQTLAKQGRLLAAELTEPGTGTLIAAVPLDAATAAALSAHVSQRAGRPIDIPAGTVLAAPIRRADRSVDLPALKAAVDLDPGRAADVLDGRIEARRGLAVDVARTILSTNALSPLRNATSVITNPERVLAALGSAVPTPGARRGNDGPAALIPKQAYQEAFGKTAIVSGSGNIGAAQFALLDANDVSVTAIARNPLGLDLPREKRASTIPADTNTVFVTATTPEKPSRAEMLSANLVQIIAPLANLLPRGATVIVTTNPVNELVSALQALRPDVTALADLYSDVARTHMFTAAKSGGPAPVVFGPHNNNMIAIAADQTVMSPVSTLGPKIYAMSDVPTAPGSANPTAKQSSAPPTGAAAVNGALHVLLGQPYAAAPVLGAANAAALSHLAGVPVNPHVSFGGLYTMDRETKALTLDTPALQRFLQGTPTPDAPQMGPGLIHFVAQTAIRNMTPQKMAEAIKTGMNLDVTPKQAAAMLNTPAVRAQMLKNVIEVQNQAWEQTASSLVNIICSSNPGVTIAMAHDLIENGGSLADGRRAADLIG